MIRALLFFSLLMSLGCDRKSDPASEYPAEVTAMDLTSGQGLPYLVGKDLRPVWKTEDAPVIRSLGDFRLVDQKGQPITSDMLKGKIAIVSFFYATCPGICPMTTRNLRPVQEQLQKDDRYVMLSFSVTPQKDTPKKLKDYARKNHIDHHRWKLVTGDRESIYKLARESFNADIYSERENKMARLKPEDFLHSENVYLLDGERKLRGIYQGRQASSMQDLLRDAGTLVQ